MPKGIKRNGPIGMGQITSLTNCQTIMGYMALDNFGDNSNGLRNELGQKRQRGGLRMKEDWEVVRKFRKCGHRP